MNDILPIMQVDLEGKDEKWKKRKKEKKKNFLFDLVHDPSLPLGKHTPKHTHTHTHTQTHTPYVTLTHTFPSPTYTPL